MRAHLGFDGKAELVGYGVFAGVYVAGPFWWQGALSEGDISNIVGQAGEVRILEAGQLRRCRIESDFRRAEYLQNGVSIPGPLLITWLPPDPGPAAP